MCGLFLKMLNSMSVQAGTTEVQPWATIVLRHISELYMTGREEDYCKNMCHAAMETGQVNSSQKNFKKDLCDAGNGLQVEISVTCATCIARG